MKILYILNIANRVNNFSYSSMMAAQELNWDFHIAGNWRYCSETERINDEEKYGIHIYQIDFSRKPYHPQNYMAYKQLLEIAKRENFDVIHSNTPIGGIVGRLIGKKCRTNTVIYQAHGFHFYKGAPLINWLIYYPIEKWMAHYTDALITINQEDYERATKKFHLRDNGKVYYVPGVGIEVENYRKADVEKEELRLSIGVLPDDIMIISVGDLIKRKNYNTAIESIAKVNNPKIKYIICGTGPEKDDLHRQVVSLGILKQVIFLGYRSDIKELLKEADIFLFTTLQEGLPRSMMEAMASGLPCIVSKIRGNVDLIDNEGGYLCDPNNSEEFYHALISLINNKETRIKMGEYNAKKIREFDLSNVQKILTKIYLGIQGD